MNMLTDPFSLRSFIETHKSLGWKATKNRIKKVLTPEEFAIFNCLDIMQSKSWSRAEYHDFEISIYPVDLWEKWHIQKGKCAVTGVPLSIENGTPRHKNPWKVSIDRIDSDKGYHNNNIRLVTHWYNNAKNTWDDKICLEAFNLWRTHINENENLRSRIV